MSETDCKSNGINVKIAVWLVVMVLAILGAGIWATTIVFASPFSKSKFNQHIWLAHPNEEYDNPRGPMVDDLIDGHLKAGTSKDYVKVLLGSPYTVSTDDILGMQLPPNVSVTWTYPVGSWSGYRMDSDFLSITFDKNGKLLHSWYWQG